MAQTKDSQCIQILNDLHTGIRISVHGTKNSISSFKKYECERLASRVGDLRKEGFDIKTDMVKTANGKRVAEYYLEPEPKPKPRPSFDIWETLPLFVWATDHQPMTVDTPTW